LIVAWRRIPECGRRAVCQPGACYGLVDAHARGV
jgi:hypothetical protein